MTIVPDDAVLSWQVTLTCDEQTDTVQPGYTLRILGGEVIEIGALPPCADSGIALDLAERAVAEAIGRCHQQPALF